jgi:hypothetical protein
MAVSQFGIIVEQLGCRDQVHRDLVGILLAQRLELRASALVEVAWLDALGNVGVVVAGTHREIRSAEGLARRVALRAASIGAAAAVASATIVARPAGATVRTLRIPVT